MIHMLKKETKNEADNNIQCVCNQIQADINVIMSEQDAMNDDEKAKNLHKINELRHILSTIEDIDQSLNTLLNQQTDKHSTEVS